MLIRFGLALLFSIFATTALRASVGDTTPDISSAQRGAPSQSVRSSLGLIVWLDDLNLKDKILSSIKRHDKEIISLLRRSGQNGVALEIKIKHVEQSTAAGAWVKHDELIDNDVKLVGAGTTLDDVWLANISRGPAQNEVQYFDEKRSFFIWFIPKGNGVVSSITSESGIRSKAARQLGNNELGALNRRATIALGVASAVSYLEENLKDRLLADKIKGLKKNQLDDAKKIADVERRLEANNDLERRAQRVSDLFGMIGAALSFAAQKDTIKSIMGGDVPSDKIDAAQSPSEVLHVIQTVVTATEQARATITSDKTILETRSQSYVTQYLEIIKSPKANYPYPEVPQLMLPVAQ